MSEQHGLTTAGFQAELFEILSALERIKKNPDLLKISIFNDSLSGL